MVPNPIRRVLSSIRTNRVKALLMGGQACILYGAAEFSRDIDIALLVDEANLERLRALLDSSVPYIGMLGPRGRTERLLSLVDGHPGLDRVFAPAGLDLGAEGPQEIASSIVAEIIAVDRGRSGGSLRDRRAPIHGEG